MKFSKVFYLVATALLISSCSNNPQTSLHLTTEQLVDKGFYAYLLPENRQVELNWTRDIYTYSLDIQCQNIVSSRVLYPIEVIYKDSNDKVVLRLNIVPFDDVIDGSLLKSQAHIDAKIFPTGEAKYGLNSDGEIIIIFKDQFGMDMTVRSTLQLNDITNLVSELQYVGKPKEQIHNPWQEICK